MASDVSFSRSLDRKSLVLSEAEQAPKQSPFAVESLGRSSTASPSLPATATVTASSTAPSTVPVPSAAESTAEPDMSFTTAADVFARLEITNGDVLTVSKVPLHALQDMDRERERRGRKVRFFYFAEQKYLIVTIPTRSHEELHSPLEAWFLFEVGRMGLLSSWRRTSAGRFPNHPPTGSSGEGDAGGQPLPARRRKDAWPTLVIESGYSQTLPSLRMKMRRWFTLSGHEVKIVLLIKAFPRSREKRVMFEQWQERRLAPPRPGATGTRSQSSNGMSAECIQTINVVWALETPYEEASEEQKFDPASFNVTRGPLVLDFACCFLREPIGPQEHDFVFPDWELQTCAAGVWELE